MVQQYIRNFQLKLAFQQNTAIPLSRISVILFTINSILITMFLFYIDEEYYNFKWMLNWGNWIAFLIYVIPLFLGQVLVYRLSPLKHHIKAKMVLSVLTGVTIGLLFVIKIVFSHL